jgi:arylsulfatase A-like enzyme
MPITAATSRTARPPRVGLWVALTVAAWHLAFFATGAVTLALATSPAGTVFEGLAETVHQKVLLASHLRVLAGYAVVALGALVLAYPAVRLWVGPGPAGRWGIAARTLVVLAVLMLHGWLRLAQAQPYFLGPATVDTWYFRLPGQWSDEVRARVLFVLFQFLPAVVAAAAGGFYLVQAARWFHAGGRSVRRVLGIAATAAILAAGWLAAPFFIGDDRPRDDDHLNIVMLSSEAVRTAADPTPDHGPQPNLAALAAESVVLSNMHSPLPSALGEAASLLTGQAPHTHGLQTPFPSEASVRHALAKTPQLPSLLTAHGYRTALVGDDGAAAYAIAGGLGFSTIEAGPDGDYPRHLAGILYPAHFIIPAWLDNRLGRRLLPHLAVLPGCVSRDTVTDRLTTQLEQSVDRGTPFFVHGVYSQAPATPPPSPGLADGAAAAGFDAQLGRVREFLKENGLEDRTILVVLGLAPDHTRNTASPLPATSAAAVPAILHVPGQAVPAGPVTQLTRLQDLAPTLLDLLGLPPEPTMQGVSLRPLLEDRQADLDLAAFGESPGFPTALPDPTAPASARAPFLDGVSLDPASGYRIVLNDPAAALRRKSRWIRTAQWQLVFTPADASPDRVDQWHLFDLRHDPAATRDVKLRNPQVWQTMETALRLWVDEKRESRLTDIFPNGEPAALPET